MTKLGRPRQWDQHFDAMRQMYVDDLKSRGEIARQFGTSVQTVTRTLQRGGIEFGDRPRDPNIGRTPEQQAAINAKISQAKKGVLHKDRRTPETRYCEHCGTAYDYLPGKNGERYCSRACRVAVMAQEKQAGVKAEYELEPRRCRCGASIPYEYRHTRQFCSPGCRLQYGAKRQKEPDKYITFSCQRPECGKEVTRLRGYSPNQRYCSNECSAKHNRTRKFYGVEGLEIVFESSYECLFWALCALWKIPIERADRDQAIEVNGNGWYCPDFWLPDLDLWVEVKGFEDDDDRDRYAAWRTDDRHLLVIRREELHELRQQATGGLAVMTMKAMERNQAYWPEKLGSRS